MYPPLIYAGALLLGVSVSTITYFTFQPTIKGWLGEQKVNKILKKLQKKGLGKNIKDITLLTKDGMSSQIDHILINQSGIFVVETKNYSGEISGNEYDLNWKQLIGNKEYSIPNFARQNLNHVKTLRAILPDYPNLPVYSFLSFNPDCRLDLDLTRTTATRYTTLANAIKIRSRIPIITDNQVNEIYKTLKSERNKNIMVSKTHVSRVKLQKEADSHAKNMNMSRNEYNDMLVEKYKKKAISLREYNAFEDIVDNAFERSQQISSDNKHKQPFNFDHNTRD